jgi:hypothetical protein
MGFAQTPLGLAILDIKLRKGRGKRGLTSHLAEGPVVGFQAFTQMMLLGFSFNCLTDQFLELLR